ncbi:MAG: shikimate kinase, partial [Lachnospiraceae bacterium]|nr:shikimate kinase [Lachnospiraceae bacterium]
MNNIILIGYMGCGKTTVGKNIAKLKKHIFTDTDELIVAQQNRSISDIFEKDGEDVFRAMETALLEKMIADGNDRLVISTGGGMPVREENRQLLRQLGTVVYMRVKPETVYERIKGDTTRPLLQCDNPLERIREMIKSRGPAYEAAAELVIDV